MKTYTAISIGPIIDTLSQVRKPRHLWSASYIFSHLMKIIIEQGTDLGGTLISPALDSDEKSGIGLYPDRAFFKSENVIDIAALTKAVFAQLSEGLSKDQPKEKQLSETVLSNYFNLMATSIVSISETEAIGELNKQLDVLELSNRCEDSEARQEILKLILTDKKSHLFTLGFEDGELPVNTLAEIATHQIKDTHPDKWGNASKLDRLLNELYPKEKRIHLLEEDIFYANLKYLGIELKSYHKYFCVVQADGDKMGDVIRNLEEGKLIELSSSLIKFGKKASDIVRDFGGLPIYAGGDDLLFIAPVVSGKDNNILKLIDDIDKFYKDLVVGEKKYKTTMSYGISISYYKYPLYEVLADARELLFTDAKTDRNTIACRLRKHSGSSFKITLNKTDEDVKKQFEKLIEIVADNSMVSAVAHKLRDTSVLWQSTHGDNDRLKAFFIKFMGLTEKEEKEESYLRVVKDTLATLVEQFVETKMKKKDFQDRLINEMRKYINENSPRADESDKSKEMIKLQIKKELYKELSDSDNKELNQNIYAMLRTAKFINGEELKDE